MIFALELSIFSNKVYNHTFHRGETGIPSSNADLGYQAKKLDIREKINLWEHTLSLTMMFREPPNRPACESCLWSKKKKTLDKANLLTQTSLLR